MRPQCNLPDSAGLLAVDSRGRHRMTETLDGRVMDSRKLCRRGKDISVVPPPPKLPIAPPTPPATPRTTEAVAAPATELIVPVPAATGEIAHLLIQTFFPPIPFLAHDVGLGDGLLEVLIPAWLAADVTLAAAGAEGAEAAVVVRAGRQLAEGVNVQVQTLVTIGAVAVAHKEIALGHLAQVVFVQELATLALLAQGAQPVLANERVVRGVAGGGGRRGGRRGGVA
ncbi:hypothetical protein CHU98_g3547, partial [Xylaria longipes]